jgi:hypothetical protein
MTITTYPFLLSCSAFFSVFFRRVYMNFSSLLLFQTMLAHAFYRPLSSRLKMHSGAVPVLKD